MPKNIERKNKKERKENIWCFSEIKENTDFLLTVPSEQGGGLSMLREPSGARFSWRTCLSWERWRLINPNHHVCRSREPCWNTRRIICRGPPQGDGLRCFSCVPLRSGDVFGYKKKMLKYREHFCGWWGKKLETDWMWSLSQKKPRANGCLRAVWILFLFGTDTAEQRKDKRRSQTYTPFSSATCIYRVLSVSKHQLNKTGLHT